MGFANAVAGSATQAFPEAAGVRTGMANDIPCEGSRYCEKDGFYPRSADRWMGTLRRSCGHPIGDELTDDANESSEDEQMEKNAHEEAG